ncbi:hypothetical protein GALMADRAFT_720062 [Galerina marginata CBS 339.88]|uniref:Uncharacterized protein n=1 Tax=Galerina marginata (strain CBS 339.88) TaxID=685588 RepID=A0A067TQP4_GALM3|nr:hypothetical protein GALMADRAFT_720062 [Galerina marginata CBS 339.88]
MRCLFFFLNLLVLITHVASLGISVQPQTLVGSPTLVIWTRDDTDPASMTFDLRFVQGDADVGLAVANVDMEVDDFFGTVYVTFPAQGQYVLKAVTGPRNTVVGTSNQITAIGLNPSSSSSSASASPSLSSSSSVTTFTPTTTPFNFQHRIADTNITIIIVVRNNHTGHFISHIQPTPKRIYNPKHPSTNPKPLQSHPPPEHRRNNRRRPRRNNHPRLPSPPIRPPRSEAGCVQ